MNLTVIISFKINKTIIVMMGLQSHELNKSQFRILQLKFLDKRIFKNGIDILSQFFYVFYLQNIKTHQV